MSRLKPTDIEKLSLTFRCLTCNAHDGSWCATKSGAPTSILHWPRTYRGERKHASGEVIFESEDTP